MTCIYYVQMYSVWRRIYIGPRFRLASGDTGTSTNLSPLLMSRFYIFIYNGL